MKNGNQWQLYRTRFLIKARRLSQPLNFVDVLGREHRGRKGDYLIEFAEGVLRILPRKFFEDVYVAMSRAGRSGESIAPSQLAQWIAHENSIMESSCARRKSASAAPPLVENRSTRRASRALIA